MTENVKDNQSNITYYRWLIVGIFLLWIVTYFDALKSVSRIWYVSEIYTHGFFVLPCSMFLIWRKRDDIFRQSLNPQYLAIPALLFFSLVGMFGFAGNISIFTHISAFATFSIAIAFLFGNGVVKIIWFPLLFVMFSVPVGDELIPLLQEITATLAEPLIGLVGVPYFRDGLYIEIPAGQFVVAEACSGIRFFIASIVFGALYAHLSYASIKKQALFLLLAIAVPVFANALRVFGIIMVGQYFGMERATGADHLVYGWFFFCIVLMILYFIGEKLRSKRDIADMSQLITASGRNSWSSYPVIAPFVILVTILALLISWQQYILKMSSINSTFNKGYFANTSVESGKLGGINWRPRFLKASYIIDSTLEHIDMDDIDLFYAWFDGVDSSAELISSVNRVYRPKHWSLLDKSDIMLREGSSQFNGEFLHVTNAAGDKRLILYWYQVPGLETSNKVKAKFKQSLNHLLGKSPQGAFFSISMQYQEGVDNARAKLKVAADTILKGSSVIKS